VVNEIPLNPSTSMVVVPKVPILTPIWPLVPTQPIVKNPFGSLFGTHGCNYHSIPSVSNPFSLGMPNMTSQLSFSILANDENTSIGSGGTDPLHTPLSFGGGNIPQTTPMIGSQPPFPLGSNTSLNAPRWSTQLSEQANSYISSFLPSSSMSIPMKTFVMKNPPLSSEFFPKGIMFHAMGNPYLGATLVWDKFYNPHKPVNWKSYAKNQRDYENYLNNSYVKKSYETYSRNKNYFGSLSNEVE
jgi:hypothetical protein